MTVFGTHTLAAPRIDLIVPVKILTPEVGDNPIIPTYASDGAAGMDLRAALAAPLTVHSGSVVSVQTGVAMAVPTGWEGQIRSRSGLTLRNGVFVPNAPGTVDSDYRGEIRVLLAALGDVYTITPGERIAQIVFCPVGRAHLTVVEELPETARGAGGFGSTGRM